MHHTTVSRKDYFVDIAATIYIKDIDCHFYFGDDFTTITTY